MNEDLTQAVSNKSNGKWMKDAGKKIDDVQSTILDGAKQAYDTVADRAQSALSNVNISSATSFVRQYPVQTAIGALAIGFLLGGALSARRSE